VVSVTLLPDALAGLFGSGPLAALAGAFLAAGFIGAFIVTNAAVVVWGKRKILAAFWEKVGPNRHGPGGVLIIVADAVRLLSKELIVPENADRPAWDLAPLLLMASALLGFAVIPMGTLGGVELQLADPAVGIAFAFAVSSLSAFAIAMAGYASNNKFAALGGLRAIASTIAYEIPLVVAAASAVLLAGSMRPSTVVAAQAEPLVTVAGLTIPSWFALVNPLAFVLFLVAALAEVGRNPFDTPEAAQEIVAGYQTEYGGVYFAILYAAEFVHIFLAGALATTLFLGGPAGPVLPGPVWFLVKIWGFFLFTQWARAAFPRLRIDQILGFGWKVLLVASFANLVLTAVLIGLTA
jgi:NADH-quinone oxidoreductase subunit H